MHCPCMSSSYQETGTADISSHKGRSSSPGEVRLHPRGRRGSWVCASQPAHGGWIKEGPPAGGVGIHPCPGVCKTLSNGCMLLLPWPPAYLCGKLSGASENGFIHGDQAGGKNEAREVKMPAGLPRLFKSALDWNLYSTQQHGAADRQVMCRSSLARMLT